MIPDNGKAVVKAIIIKGECNNEFSKIIWVLQYGCWHSDSVISKATQVLGIAGDQYTFWSELGKFYSAFRLVRYNFITSGIVIMKCDGLWFLRQIFHHKKFIFSFILAIHKKSELCQLNAWHWHHLKKSPIYHLKGFWLGWMEHWDEYKSQRVATATWLYLKDQTHLSFPTRVVYIACRSQKLCPIISSMFDVLVEDIDWVHQGLMGNFMLDLCHHPQNR